MGTRPAPREYRGWIPVKGSALGDSEKVFLKWLTREKEAIDALLTSSLDAGLIAPSGILSLTEEEALHSDLARALRQPLKEFLLRGGKRIRPIIMKLCHLAVSGKDGLREALLIPELIHTGTLIVDDIEDSSLLRRGKPALHTLIGEDLAINAGNYLYFSHSRLLKDVTAEQRAKALSLITVEMEKLHLGQALDILWHSAASRIPSEKEYLTMCRLKTGTLMRLAAKLGALLGGGNPQQIEALGAYAENLGVAFQIRDDTLNVKPGQAWGKEYGEDILEGKRSLLVVRTLEVATQEDKAALTAILDSHAADARGIRDAVALFTKYDSFDYADGLAQKLVDDACLILKQAVPESAARSKLSQLAKFSISRKI